MVGCHGCVAATCEDALELLLADHFVRVPVHNVDGNAIDVLKEHVPVLVLRSIISRGTTTSLEGSVGETTGKRLWLVQKALIGLAQPTLNARGPTRINDSISLSVGCRRHIPRHPSLL